jgi:hypothetical protein
MRKLLSTTVSSDFEDLTRSSLIDHIDGLKDTNFFGQMDRKKQLDLLMPPPAPSSAPASLVSSAADSGSSLKKRKSDISEAHEMERPTKAGKMQVRNLSFDEYFGV